MPITILKNMKLIYWVSYFCQGHDLLEFSRESVVVYLDDEDAGTRKDAALCCCRLVANSLSGIAQYGSTRSTRAGGRRRRLVEEVLHKY